MLHERNSPQLVHAIGERAQPLRNSGDLGPLIDRVKNSRVVMLGEASHGTHEFYEWRRQISEELIKNHGFRFIAVEGDWPPCRALHEYVTRGEYGSAQEALASFTRWPTWMWANNEIEGLADWLRHHNRSRSPQEQVGFHGLDVYSLFESIDEVIADAEKINPFLARRIRAHYQCFEKFRQNERGYARSLLRDPEGCESPADEALHDLMEFRLNGLKDREFELFDARQNARVVCNAENYYRTMVLSDDDSWNVRDRHMMETLEILLEHYGPEAKAIVWEHNTHIGDYRATDMHRMGQVNIGGLARQKLGEKNVALVGFGTYHGSVIASHAWDGPIQALPVPDAREGTYEAAFHEVATSKRMPDFYIVMDDQDRAIGSPLSQVHGHRAIGVVYDPDHERWGNYVPTALSYRYDAFIFNDETHALEPHEIGFNRNELPETWPKGQ